MIVSKEAFFKLQSKFKYIPFNQTAEWLASHFGSTNRLLYFVDSVEEPRICSWGKVYNRKIVGEHLVIEGIAFNDWGTSDIIKNFFKSIISEGFSLIELSDISLYNANFEVGIRRAGFIRPLGLSLSPLTLVVNLKEPHCVHRNWRRNVNKSLKQGVKFIHVEKPTIFDMEAFVKLFNELKERKKLKFSLRSNDLIKLFANDQFKLFFVQDATGRFLAGRIEYINGHNVYDVYAANSNESIKYGSVYYLQEEIFKYLRNIGMKTFDYGRISPTSDCMDDVYLAKSYSGGEPTLYNGQWQYSKSHLMDYLYSFYKHYLQRQSRY